MIKYKARFVTPDSKNKAYLIVSHGGLNHCIEGNPAGRIVEGCVLPNCCGEVHGRCIETIGSDEMLCRGNAENYWAYTKDGLPRSQTPQVGSIMCWRKGKAGVGSDGAGHVAWVEEVNSHGDVLVSESGWTGTKANGRYFRLRKLKRVNGTYALGVNYFFQGFIHVYDPDEIVPVKHGIYRLYHQKYGHMFTAKIGEADSLVRGGWTYEKIGWLAPEKGDAVFRLYNPNNGDHLFTVKEAEKKALMGFGWKYEGIAFRSDSRRRVPIYRLYNRRHMYTASKEERDALIKGGWLDEGIGFYGEGL